MTMLRGVIVPSVEIVAEQLRKKLLAALIKADGDEVVLKKGTTQSKMPRRRRERFAPGEMVNILTSADNDVCEECTKLAAGSPYTIEEARRQLPHHYGCRCFVLPLRAHDIIRGQRPRAHVRSLFRGAVRRVGRAIRTGKLRPIIGKPATVKGLRKILRTRSKRYVSTGTKLVRRRKRR